MFYGTHFIMSPPTKSKLKRQSQLLSSVLSRTLSYKYRDLDATFCSLGASDDPAELSTQLSAPGVLKVFGDSVCSGTHYKSVLATGMSSAQELVKEALERYSLSPDCASQYVLCDVVGQAGDSGRQWQAECFRVFGDNEKPLLIQELWKPREGLSRRFELRKRSDMEELAAKDVDTMTAERDLCVAARLSCGLCCGDICAHKGGCGIRKCGVCHCEAGVRSPEFFILVPETTSEPVAELIWKSSNQNGQRWQMNYLSAVAGHAFVIPPCHSETTLSTNQIPPLFISTRLARAATTGNYNSREALRGTQAPSHVRAVRAVRGSSRTPRQEVWRHVGAEGTAEKRLKRRERSWSGSDLGW
ncbi:Ras-associating and dilute domain-containing protein [Galemys pyrenaicus]|uniref:Ras-associating and dilute domain-containing protein n=1 Tax=Galemys pyrenaicus TaxID=202257 RepID=A0A8J6E0R9_GALPY|nr:Ras-associating and dilute domain-containing protein [Galemys pyrenaicus]